MINSVGGGVVPGTTPGAINPRLLLLHQLLGGAGGGFRQPGIPGIHGFGPPPSFPGAFVPGMEPTGQAPPGFAQVLHGLGADPQGAALWEARHPAAMGTPTQPGSENIPGWVLAAQEQGLNDASGGPGASHQAHVGNAADIVSRLVQHITGSRQARNAPPPSLRRGRGVGNPRFDY